MASSSPTSRQIRFGEFILDLDTAELRKNGYQSTLQGQPFQILQILVERPGSLVTRDELKKRLWPSDTFVDFDQGLNKAVKRLREALEDSADHPRFIETLPRRGYRFIGHAEVSVDPSYQEKLTQHPILATSSTDGAPRAAAVTRTGLVGPWPRWFRANRYVVLSVFFGLLAAGFAAYHFWPRSNSPSSFAKITQISQWNKPMRSTRLSPDGHAVAFVSPADGIEQVFLMLTSGGEPLQLTSDEGDKYVDSFSPDGKEVYYRRDLGHNEIWAMPALGGSPRRVASGRFLVPSLDGASIYYTKVDNPGIFRAEKSGLNEELVYKPEGKALFFSPLLPFPGGNDLLAGGLFLDPPNVHLFRINLTNHEANDLGEMSANFDVNPNTFDIAWAEPGNSVLFSRTADGLTNIWKYSLKDRSLAQITFGTGPDYSPMPAPGGKGIYYVNGKSSGFLTAYNVHTKESTDIVSEDATQPDISPDGKHVMYLRLAAGKRHELWVSNIDGGNKVKIATGENLSTGTWAQDSFHLAFAGAEGDAGVQVHIVGADGSGLRQVPSLGIQTANGVWSADQKSIFMNGIEKEDTIWKWNLDGSTGERLVNDCGITVDADPVGKYLLVVQLSGARTGIYEVSISDKKCIPLLPGVETFAATFASDGKSFLYAMAHRGEVTIYRQPWSDGKIIGAPQVAVKVPFAFPLHYIGNGYDFSRDLSTIVYARPGGHADLYLLSQK